MFTMPIATTVLIATLASAPGVEKDGSLSKAAIMSVVKTHMLKVKDCYERALVNYPALKGTVVLTWSVEPDGRVSGARVATSTLKSAQVETCIVSEVERWIFPKAPKKTRVTSFPFAFNEKAMLAPPLMGGLDLSSSGLPERNRSRHRKRFSRSSLETVPACSASAARRAASSSGGAVNDVSPSLATTLTVAPSTSPSASSGTTTPPLTLPAMTRMSAV
jgi:hypothetical protein